MSPLSSYLLLLAISMVFSIATGAFAFVRSATPPARWFALIAAIQAFWSGGQAMEIVSPDLKAKLLWDNLQWIPALGLPLALGGFALAYTGGRLRGPRLAWGAALTVSLAALAAAFFDGSRGLMRTGAHIGESGPFPELMYGFGPVHRAVNVWIFGLAAAALLSLLNYALRAPRLYRMQALVIFAGASFPYLAGIGVLTGVYAGPQRDALPIAFGALNLFIAWGLFRFRLFDVVPLARARIVEGLADPVAVFDAMGRLVDCNPALRALLPPETGDPLGLPAAEILPEWPGLTDLDPGEPRETDVRWERGDARPWFNARFLPLRDRRGALLGSALVMRDITERLKAERELQNRGELLEEQVRERTAELLKANEQIRRELTEREIVESQLRQSQKMESLGRLAGGVAHDLNNLLVPILAYTELSLADPALPAVIRSRLEEIRKAGERAAGLSRQILAFSRRQVLQVVPLDLGALVREAEGMLRRLIGADVDFRTELPRRPVRVKADRSQLEQIVLNLAVNARDAMPGGGALSLRVFETPGPPEGFDFDAAPPSGPCAVIEVADTGCGMDEATLRMIFEPFFTTKPPGKGTGLGLSTVFGVVRQHGGGIRVESEPGRGSVFRIALPALAGEAAESGAVPAAAPAPEGLDGTATILVVDDEPIVRRIAVAILRARGYRVLQASGAPEALGQVSLHEGPLDLLLTDIVMPQMNGRALAEKLRAMRPGVKVLFISGHSDAEMAERGLLDAGEGFLPKPFDAKGLALKVREVLAGPSGAGRPREAEGAPPAESPHESL